MTHLCLRNKPLKNDWLVHIAIYQALLPIVTKTSNNHTKPVKIKPSLPAAIGSLTLWPCVMPPTASMELLYHHNLRIQSLLLHIPATTSDLNLVDSVIYQVSLEFSPSSAVPGEDVTMQVTADPNSLCGVSAIDKSVLLQEPGKSLDADKVITVM